MTLHHAYLIKGWLLDKDPPKEVTEAVEAIIEAAGDRVQTLTIRTDEHVLTTAGSDGLPDRDPAAAAQPEAITTSGKQTRRTSGWTPERRAAQAEMMRQRQANGSLRRKHEAKAPQGSESPSTAEGEDEPQSFTEAELRITVPKPRRKSQLTDSDWPEIKEMVEAGRDRKVIASDFDEDPEDLDHFIASCQRREGKSPGEATAPLSSVTAGAARRTW